MNISNGLKDTGQDTTVTVIKTSHNSVKQEVELPFLHPAYLQNIVTNYTQSLMKISQMVLKIWAGHEMTDRQCD